VLGAERPIAPAVAVGLPLAPSVVVPVVEPDVPPPVVLEAGTRVLEPAASCLNAARVLLEEVLPGLLAKRNKKQPPAPSLVRQTHFSLMTMTIPFSQCLPCAQ
jgi:hypothetical protein